MWNKILNFLLQFGFFFNLVLATIYSFSKDWDQATFCLAMAILMRLALMDKE